MPHALALKVVDQPPEMSQELAVVLARARAGVPLAQIGEGATSVVWKVADAESGKLAACKIAKAPPDATEAVAREGLLGVARRAPLGAVAARCRSRLHRIRMGRRNTARYRRRADGT